MPDTAASHPMPDRSVVSNPPPLAEPNPHLATLPRNLYWAARDAAHVALQGYTREDAADKLQAAISAGTAAEYLLRAVLASRDPLLLADRGSVVSLIMLSRANGNSGIDIRKLRTVKTGDALNILFEMHPSLKIRDDFQSVMVARNAAAHVAIVDDAILAEAVQKLVVVVDALHELLNRQPADFWGTALEGVVGAMRDEYSDAVRRRVESKIAFARAQLQSIVGDLGAADRESTLVALETRVVRYASADEHKDQQTECPACERWGWTTYLADRDETVETEVTDQPDGSVEVTHTVAVYYWASMFQCPVCGLYLDGNELTPTSIPSELATEYEDVEDPYADFEPDPDFM